MADIGRSSTAHICRQEIHYPAGHEALDNYGAWYRNAPGAGRGIVQPMFKEMESGYKTLSGLRSIYDEDRALETDRLMARMLNKIDVAIIFCRYVDCISSRDAAKKMLKHTGKISANEYALRLEGGCCKD